MDYIAEVNAYYTELAKLDRSDPDGGPIRGSALGHCQRKLFAKLQRVPTLDLTPRSKRIFQIGDDRDVALSDALRARLADRGFFATQHEVWIPLPRREINDIQLNIRVVERYAEMHASPHRPRGTASVASIQRNGERISVRARCDVAFQAGTGWRQAPFEIVEIKTMSDFSFSKAKKSGVDGLGWDYQVQLMGQMHGVEHQGYERVKAGWLIENKDTSELLYLPFEPPMEAWERYDQLLVSIRDMLYAWFDGKPLDWSQATFAMSLEGDDITLPWQCNYCDVGPETGRCLPGYALTNTAKKGEIPKWRASRSPTSEPA
jgi:hypothetical protein